MQVFKGHILYTPAMGELAAAENSYIVVDDTGLVEGIYQSLPERFAALPLEDLGDKLVLPGFCDLHLHSSQLPIAGLGYDDGEDWFVRYATPIEKKYEELDYAKKLNQALVQKLWENGVLHSNIMSSCAKGPTRNLMQQLDEKGLGAFVGKMNADFPAFAPAPETTEESICGTEELILWAEGLKGRVRYALCPEFVPTASAELLDYLGKAAETHQLPVHSHMSEAEFDTAKVRERFPQYGNYGQTLNAYGLFGQQPTVMAHCLHCLPDELALMKKNQVFVAHCPTANMHSPSGCYLPVRRFLAAGIPVGISSDFGGGHTLNQMQVMVSAIHTSKTFFDEKGLSSADALYLATKGPGAYFGNTGSFETGYRFDALVVDDAELNRFMDYSLPERLQRFIYCGSHRHIAARYMAGKMI